MKIVSFDVFDTLLTRCTATPEGIFAIMGKRLKIDQKYANIDRYIIDNFSELRIHSQKLARESICVNGIQEITLQDIYMCLSMTGKINKKEMGMLMDLEYNTEFLCSIPILENIQKLKKVLAQGKKVICISDMYLDSIFIRSLLEKADLCFCNIPIYVSVDYGKNKWSGQLYEIIRDKECVEYSDWIHWGDNVFSDIKSPKKHGITAGHLYYESLMTHEKKYLKKDINDWELQFDAGISRATRTNGILNFSYKMGSSIGGGILYPYVSWLLEDCLKRKLNRLYFIARDGYILKKIADIIICQKKYDIETYYIYGSRKAWRMASLTNSVNNLDPYIWCSNIYNVKNFSDFAEIFQLSPDELYDFFPEHMLKDEVEMTWVFFEYCRKKVNENSKFIDFLCRKHKEKRKLLTEYLKQEINYSDDRFAFVELGGTGFTQKCLCQLMGEFYKGKCRTYFYKLDQYHKNDLCTFYDFFPSFLECNVVIEMLARAPHGQTLGYFQNGSRVYPVMDEEGWAIKEYGYDDYAKGIQDYAILRCQKEQELMLQNISVRIPEKYLEYIVKTPDKMVLNYIGDMPTSETGRGEIGNVFAPKLTDDQIRTLFWDRQEYEPIERFYKGTYLQYSLKRCSKLQRAEISHYKEKYYSEEGTYNRLAKQKRKAGNLPVDALKGKIVLYAGGKLGCYIYDILEDISEVEIVLWVDKNYELIKNERNIQNPEKIKEVLYDILLIAVKDEYQYISIRETLLEMDVEDRKIVWFNLNIQGVYHIVDENNKTFKN